MRDAAEADGADVEVLVERLGDFFEARLPRRAPKLAGHVVVYRYGPAVESALELFVEDQLKNFDLDDLRQLRELLDAEIAARS